MRSAISYSKYWPDGCSGCSEERIGAWLSVGINAFWPLLSPAINSKVIQMPCSLTK